MQEGLLKGERNRGLFVMELADDDIKDVYAVPTATRARRRSWSYVAAGRDR